MWSYVAALADKKLYKSVLVSQPPVSWLVQLLNMVIPDEQGSAIADNGTSVLLS